MKVKDTLIAGGFLALLLLSGACTHSEIKPTEDIKRIQQIDSFLEDLRHLLQAKDLTGLSARYPQDRQEEIQALAQILTPIEQPRLDFFIDRILLDQDTATVALHWEFRWGQSPETVGDSKSLEQRGNATLRLKGTLDLHLLTIEGDNPFLAPLSALGGEKVLSQ